MRLRLLFISILFVAGYGLLIYNLYDLQLEKGDYYTKRAAAQNAGDLAAKRGNIYFSDKNANRHSAALNREFPIVYAVPKEISDAPEAAAQLEPIVGKPKGLLEKALSKPNDLYELLLEKAGVEQVDSLNALNLRGVYVKNEVLRFYPLNNLASQVLGFVGINQENDRPAGLYGAELFYGSQLKGKDGQAIGDQIVSPEAGRDLTLTIDRNLQIKSEETLAKLMAEFKAAAGTVIIQNPKTGEILAMASKPDFDPNFYSSSSVEMFINPAVQKIYEPGSVFKIITMAAGIDSGKIAPGTSYYDTGSVKVADRVIANWDHKAHGKVTMTEVIEKSINTGAVYAERQIGHENFYNYLLKFGFGRKSGADLPGELAGDLKHLLKKSPPAGRAGKESVNFATASFGQGVAVTPLQLINAASVIANGGVLMRPYINKDLGPQVLDRVINKESARKTAQMMVSAVDKAGVASIPNYSVAGKTGTAQIPDFKKGGYSGQFVHTYAGWAPAFDPAFVALIKLDKPEAELAALTVVPAFKELAEFALNYYRVPPDRLINN